MANIVLTRIDDRLIHGQVMTAWTKTTKATRIIIVDDMVAKDSFMQKVLTMAAPPEILVEVYGIEEAAKVLKGEFSDDEKIIILVKVPATVEGLIANGVNIKEVILGGMGATPDRKKFYKNISVSKDEKESLSRLLNKGVKINIKIVPDDKGIEVSNLL